MSEKDLIPFDKLTESEQKELARKGGIRSGQVRREKKLMSQIYAEFLDKDHDIIGKDGLKKKLSGNALVASVMSKVLSRGDSASVSLLKEIREATEGTAVNVKIDRFQKIIQSMTEDQISDIFEE